VRAIQVTKPGGAFVLVDKEVPQPSRGHVRIKVEACGICHSDAVVKEGMWPGLKYPRTPGHEIAGVVDEVGEGVPLWKKGQRVGVGWHGGHCFHCDACRRGDFIACANASITGISFDGGYAEYMVAPHEALAAIPDDLSALDAAPLLCAGITTFNALRNSGARAGDVVAVQGIGGLGHLGIQYASKLGFKTVALSHGNDKQELARRLGADVFVNTAQTDPVEVLRGLGGATVVLATAPSSSLISPLVQGLAPNGRLLVVAAAPEPLSLSPLHLIAGRKSVAGWASGTAKDSEDTMRFSVLRAVRASIETFPLAKAAEAYERMITNKARFRIVLQV
jgi:propanol-preferring alcohol dehydrogenase